MGGKYRVPRGWDWTSGGGLLAYDQGSQRIRATEGKKQLTDSKRETTETYVTFLVRHQEEGSGLGSGS